MSEKINDRNPEDVGMLSIEELRKFPGNENLTDKELQDQAIFLKEFSLILYHAYAKQISEKKDI